MRIEEAFSICERNISRMVLFDRSDEKNFGVRMRNPNFFATEKAIEEMFWFPFTLIQHFMGILRPSLRQRPRLMV